MSAAKHTPGPWSADITSEGPYGGAFEVFAPNAGTGRWRRVICARNQHPECAEEMAANARLIAAAPELLAACQMVVTLKRVGGMLPGVRELIDSVVEDAEAAIAKATGGAA
jgi:hypothetical protein